MGKISNMKIEYIDAAKKKTAILHYQKRKNKRTYTFRDITTSNVRDYAVHLFLFQTSVQAQN